MSVPVKVCGITRLEDAEVAIAEGAQALGFMFFPDSPRYVTPEQAAEIIAALPPFAVTVGVFVREQVEKMNRIAAFCPLDRIQLHGGEDTEVMAALERPAYRAFRIKEQADLAAVQAAPERTVMLDTYDPHLLGGTGRPFDWSLARQVTEKRQVILAGGLNPDNVARAVAEAGPAAVDVSSGVEARPGVKDPARLAAFFRALEGHSFPTPSPWSGAHASAR